MGQYRKILVVTDPAMTDSTAPGRAAGLARQTGASLHLCLVDYRAGIAALRYVDESVLDLARDAYMKPRLQWLEQQCASLAADGIQADYSAVWGHPAEQMILAKVFEQHPDLLIKDAHAGAALMRPFHTPLDWQLLRLCPVPMMLVSPQSAATPRRIIAAVDPMEAERGPAELNDRVLQTALAMAIQCDAELHVLYVFTFLPLVGDDIVGLANIGYPKLHEQLRATHRQAFDRLLDRHSVPADRRHFIEHAFPEAAISEFANQSKTDLVVMGTVYRSGVDRLIFGSTAERTLYRLNCDVLALKPEGFLVNLQHWFNATVNPGVNYPGAAQVQ
jgi:universal stress protein E